MVKNPSAVQEMQETKVLSLGWEREGNHTSVLAWKIPWTEEPGSSGPRGCKESDTTEVTEHIS